MQNRDNRSHILSVYVCVYVCVCVCIYMYVYVHMCACLCVYMCMCVYVYVYESYTMQVNTVKKSIHVILTLLVLNR